MLMLKREQYRPSKRTITQCFYQPIDQRPDKIRACFPNAGLRVSATQTPMITNSCRPRTCRQSHCAMARGGQRMESEMQPMRSIHARETQASRQCVHCGKDQTTSSKDSHTTPSRGMRRTATSMSLEASAISSVLTMPHTRMHACASTLEDASACKCNASRRACRVQLA